MKWDSIRQLKNLINNNQFKLDNLSIQLIILETKLVNSIDIIQRFYKYITNNANLFKKNITVFKFFFIICFFLILGKVLFKNFKNSVNTPWPNLYTLDPKGEIYPKTKIKINENYTYYLADKGDNLCMYTKIICTSYIINNLKYSIKKNYLFLNTN